MSGQSSYTSHDNVCLCAERCMFACNTCATCCSGQCFKLCANGKALNGAQSVLRSLPQHCADLEWSYTDTHSLFGRDEVDTKLEAQLRDTEREASASAETNKHLQQMLSDQAAEVQQLTQDRCWIK